MHMIFNGYFLLKLCLHAAFFDGVQNYCCYQHHLVTFTTSNYHHNNCNKPSCFFVVVMVQWNILLLLVQPPLYPFVWRDELSTSLLLLVFFVSWCIREFLVDDKIRHYVHCWTMNKLFSFMFWCLLISFPSLCDIKSK